VIAVLTRYVSLASLGATISIPLFIFLGSFVRPVSGTVPTLAAAVFCAGLIVFAHRENIRRLASGTESKFK
jgi:glycerol-3-phosphate acyltransferase PlsY